MTRPLLVPLRSATLIGVAVLMAAGPARAQDADRAALSDPALAPTAEQLRDDLRTVTHMVATAALARDAAGDFPTTPFGLLGSAAASRTGLRAVALSELTVGRDGDRLVLSYVPLPEDPYVREDRVVRLVVTPGAGGRFTGDYEIRRRADPDQGGRTLPYDTAGRYLVERAFGTACVDLAVVQGQLAAGTFAPEPGTLSAEPLTIRVHPVGEAAPVYYREGPARGGR